ncbi:MAG: tetratricopeptide repeat protein [Heliobacteriaceae bacterium]|jgi:superkiller protein 3|nr:tetratricopeptide repeat protein [Heliobacteriaceae bacterium]
MIRVIKLLLVYVLTGLCAGAALTPEANTLYQQASASEYRHDYKAAADKLQQAIKLNPNEVMLYTKLAGIYTDAGEFDKALAAYTRAVELRPGDAFVYISIGSIYENKGEYKQALGAYRQALKLYPEYKYNYLNIANVEYQLEDYKSAIVDYNKFLSTYARHREARESLANAYLRNKNYASSIAEYEKLYAADPVNFNDYANYGIALFEMKNYSKAAGMLEKAVETAPDNTNCRIALALSYQELEKNDLALAQYDVIFRQQPALNSLRYDYANLLADMEQNSNAIEQYKMYTSNYPNDPRAYVNAAVVYRRVNNMDEAVKNYEKALELTKDSPDTGIKKALAECYHIQKDYPKAIQLYDEALAVTPNDYTLRLNKAYALHSSNQYGQAIVLYEQLLKEKNDETVKANLAAAFIAQGKIYMEEKNYTLSTENFEKAINQGTKDSFAYFGLAQSYAACGLAERAEANFEKAISMAPDKKIYSAEYAKFIAQNSSAAVAAPNTTGEFESVSVPLSFEPAEINTEKNKSLIQIGDENYKLKNYDASIKNYQEALKINPNDEVTLLKLGNIYKVKGNSKDAAGFYKKAVFVNPGYADGWFNLGLVYAGEKNITEAKECFSRVIALDPDYGYAYFALAIANETEGNKSEAVKNYKIFLSKNSNESAAAAVREKIKSLEQ